MFTFSVTSEKHWRDKGGTDVADGVTRSDGNSDTDSGRDTDEVSVHNIQIIFNFREGFFYARGLGFESQVEQIVLLGFSMKFSVAARS